MKLCMLISSHHWVWHLHFTPLVKHGYLVLANRYPTEIFYFFFTDTTTKIHIKKEKCNPCAKFIKVWLSFTNYPTTIWYWGYERIIDRERRRRKRWERNKYGEKRKYCARLFIPKKYNPYKIKYYNLTIIMLPKIQNILESSI